MDSVRRSQDRWDSSIRRSSDCGKTPGRKLIPYLDYDTEILRALFSTNAIDPLSARYRRPVKARGHFPADAVAPKYFYPVTRSPDPNRKGQA